MKILEKKKMADHLGQNVGKIFKEKPGQKFWFIEKLRVNQNFFKC